MQPDNAQLLKLKGDVLKDLENMPAAEEVIEICNPIRYWQYIVLVLQEGIGELTRWHKHSY